MFDHHVNLLFAVKRSAMFFDVLFILIFFSLRTYYPKSCDAEII
jgi:hypothetical protein